MSVSESLGGKIGRVLKTMRQVLLGPCVMPCLTIGIIAAVLTACGGGTNPVPTPSGADSTPPAADFTATRLDKDGHTIAQTTLSQGTAEVDWNVGPNDTVVIVGH